MNPLADLPRVQDGCGDLLALHNLAERLQATERSFDYRVIKRPRAGVGNPREVVKPLGQFETVSKRLYETLQAVTPYRPPAHVYGFVRGRATRDNAARHLGAACILRVDIKDFFMSTPAESVLSALLNQGWSERAADLITCLCTLDNKLPVGLSTSPWLSNLVCARLDLKLSAYAAAAGLTLTRYVDDLAISAGDADVTQAHLEEIEGLVGSEGWLLNPRKTAFMRRGRPQYVTGLYVGDVTAVRIPRVLKRQMRLTLRLIRSVGYDEYMETYGKEAGFYPKRLRGFALYIASVEPDVGWPMVREVDRLTEDWLPDWSDDSDTESLRAAAQMFEELLGRA